MLKFRVVQETGFGAHGLWWAEEKTSFGWERITGFAATAQEANELLDKERQDATV